MMPATIVNRIMSFLRKERRYRGLRGVGQQWERVAENRLKAEGYRIRERNFRGRAGEIDFIAEDGGVLCFIEVKGRRSLRFGTPAEAVIAAKQGRIIRAAEEYIKRRRVRGVPCRFDVVSIVESDAETRVVILRDAFQLPEPRPPRG